MRVRTLLVAVFAMILAADLDAADEVRIGESNYNISNLTVGPLDGLRKSMNLRRQVPRAKLPTWRLCFDAQRELGLRK
jgi:hypothetical protein